MEKRSRYAVPNPPTWCRHSTGRPTLFLKSATRGRSTSSWNPLLGQAAQLSECSLGSTPLLMGRLQLSGIRFQHSSYLHQLACFPLSLSFRIFCANSFSTWNAKYFLFPFLGVKHFVVRLLSSAWIVNGMAGGFVQRV